MKVYKCTDFEGHYPVGSAALVVAENRFQAQNILESRLSSIGLAQQIHIESIIPVVMETPSVHILCDGNY